MDVPAASKSPIVPLAVHGVTVTAGSRLLVRELSLELAAGEFLAVLGRNGSGKTLTLHTLAGLRPPAAGEVLLDTVGLASLSRRQIACRIGVLTQDTDAGLATTVLESVLISRHPHLKLLQREGAADRGIARASLASVGLAELEGRNLDSLSGGEQRRVAIAALLAQDPQVFLLDEPTNHLDPQHQLAVLGRFRALADAGRTVMATLHDPTLAARFADRALLLYGDGRYRLGPAADVLSAQSLGELYQSAMLELHAGGRRIFVGA